MSRMVRPSPRPSPQEREKRSQRAHRTAPLVCSAALARIGSNVAKATSAPQNLKPRALLPLLGAEGRGEGERFTDL